jgi:tryptophan 2-monooxygenase
MTTPAAPSDGYRPEPVTVFGPDFPFAYDAWLRHPAGLGSLPKDARGATVGIIGAGLAGLVAAYELMELGLRPVVYEPARVGGRLRSHEFEGATGIVAELGGMRFPSSGRAFFHYAGLLGLSAAPFPNPLTEAAGSTVIDIAGRTFQGRTLDDLPPEFTEVARAWDDALDEIGYGALQDAIRARDAGTLKRLWDELVPLWDGRTFYDFVATSKAFARLPFRYREMFGLVGFGTGGWDSDFPNSMLEILRVVVTNCDTDQQLIVGGAEQLPRGLWTLPVTGRSPWPAGTTLASLHGGVPRPGVAAIRRPGGGAFAVRDRWGTSRFHDALLATCQSWLLTTQIECDESIFSQDLWMALDRTRYMQSSKTFVMVDRPFWQDVNPDTGYPLLGMTLTDRLTRGTYLFDNGPGRPAVICLTYSWMSDALKMLPYDVDQRVRLALDALGKIYPGVDIAGHIVGDPVTVSWENDPNFLGAFKGALPGHYRYNRRMYAHFMQDGLAPAERGIFLAGDDVSFTPGWAEGAVQTALNAVWGVMTHFGGRSRDGNPGPGDLFGSLAPVDLGE